METIIETIRLAGVVLILCIGLAGYGLILLRRHFKLLKAERLVEKGKWLRDKYGSRG